MDVVDFTPTLDEYVFTFGGAAPVRRVAPGTALRIHLCCAGRRRRHAMSAFLGWLSSVAQARFRCASGPDRRLRDHGPRR